MVTKHSVKVSDLPFIDSIMEVSKDERRKLGLYLPSGQINDYRRAFMLGQGGSRKEKTWNRYEHIHTCCNSKVPWRHRNNCPGLEFIEPTSPLNGENE